MSKSKAPPPPERIELNFSLFDLPTAQHKAGLAGLLLQVQAMKDRKLDASLIPEVDISPAAAQIVFTEASLQGLFQDLYDATYERVAVINKWAGAELKGEVIEESIDPKTNKTKQVKKFLYDVVQPTAPLLERHLDSPKDNAWLKLWRKMIWEIPRGINTTRAPFNEMADLNAKDEKGPAKFATTLWASLVKFAEKRSKNQLATDSISSALLLGAQDVNAEVVPFQGQIDHNLLLHFWQVVVLTFRPYLVDIKGNLEAVGYVLAIPEVSDMKEFLHEFPILLAKLDKKKRGYIPEAACIDIPVQAGLEFLHSLHALASDKVRGQSWESCLSAVECFHMEKRGNSIKMISFERLTNRAGLLTQYEQIRSTFRNPLFRVALLRSLLRDQPWYGEMLVHFAERDWPFFVESEDTPRFLPRFARDARARFRTIYKDSHDMSAEDFTSEQKEPDRLALIVRRLITTYVESKTESKTGKTLKKEVVNGKTKKTYTPEFQEMQRRVCSDAFLAMRSRHDNDFVEYFVGSICSVAQFLPPKDYQFLTNILLRKTSTNATGPLPLSWEDVKSLAMLSVSACSFYAQTREAKPQESKV